MARPSRSRLHVLLAPVAAVLVVSTLAASVPRAQTRANPLFRRANAPRMQVELDLASGTYTRGPSQTERGGTTVADFQNLDSAGWMSVDTGGGSCRWFSNGAKGTAPNQSQNASDLITSIVFFYCSNALDTLSGGAGGSVTLGFYEGYTAFGGAPTTTAIVVALTGMPANSVAGSFLSPGAGCYGLKVSFNPLVAFADGPFIGYSWQFDDLGTDGVLGATYPTLACVASCSGTSFVPDGQGMIDVMDQYCTTPAVQSSFSFGTIGGPFSPGTSTSINMQIQEAGDLLATSLAYNATLTPNADTLAATPAILGQTWTATLTRATPSAAGGLLLTLRRNRTPLPNGTAPMAPLVGRVLIAGPLLAQLPGSHDGTSGTITSAVPLDFAFCNLHIAAQCRTSSGGFLLSSAVEGTIGTF